VKGLEVEPPTALVYCHVKPPSSSCWENRLCASVVSMAEPLLRAWIQRPLWAEKLVVPLEEQLPQRKFAVITPFAMPDPLSSSTSRLEVYCGIDSPREKRGESVTFPLPSVYMMNMFEFVILDPIPSPTQLYVVGALSER
jgi:hypothetical protein